jgi:hypothetical protein
VAPWPVPRQNCGLVVQALQGEPLAGRGVVQEAEDLGALAHSVGPDARQFSSSVLAWSGDRLRTVMVRERGMVRANFLASQPVDRLAGFQHG